MMYGIIFIKNLKYYLITNTKYNISKLYKNMIIDSAHTFYNIDRGCPTN